MSGPTAYRRPRRRSGLCWLYVALIGLWLALRASYFDQIWWLAVLNSFALYLFLPLPLLLTAAPWRRRKDASIDLATATSSAYARRAAEVDRLTDELRGLDAPALLLCDCNLTETSQAHAGLQALLADSFREAS